MARSAKDVERECGQFLEQLERQYERAEDRIRRSNTINATTTARMTPAQLDAEEEQSAPSAQQQAVQIPQEEASVQPDPEEQVFSQPEQQVESPEAVEDEEPMAADVPVEAEPEPPVPTAEEGIAAPDAEYEEESHDEDSDSQEEPDGDDSDEEEDEYDDEEDEEEGPAFGDVVKENLAKAGGLLAAFGGRIVSGSRSLVSRLRRGDSIEEEDFDEYGETPAPAETPVVEEAVSYSADVADVPQTEEEELPEAADADMAQDAQPAAANWQDQKAGESEPEESFDEQPEKRDLFGGIKAMFARLSNRSGEEAFDPEEDEEEYEQEGVDEPATVETATNAEPVMKEDQSAQEELPETVECEPEDLCEAEEPVCEPEDQPEPAEDFAAEEVLEEAALEPARNELKEERTMSQMDNNNQKTLSELLAEGMSDTPSLSRRERRALSEAAENEKKTAAKDVVSDLELEMDQADEEPTVEFQPVRKREEEKKLPTHKAPARVLDDLDYEDDEDDEEEEEVAPKKSRKEKKKEKKRVIEEDDYDDDEDYEDEYDEDEDYDEDDDEEEEVSFSKRLLGFIKGLIAVVLVVLLVVLVLRLLEAGGYLTLDWLRDGIGETIPFIHSIFPKPAA